MHGGSGSGGLLPGREGTLGILGLGYSGKYTDYGKKGMFGLFRDDLEYQAQDFEAGGRWELR